MRTVAPIPRAMLAAALVAAPLAAQDSQTGSRLLPRQVFNARRDQDAPIALSIAHRMAGCAVVQHPSASRRYLDATSADDVAKWHRTIFANELSCNNVLDLGTGATDIAIRPPLDVERGMIAEAVLDHSGALPTLPAEPLKAQYTSVWQGVSGRAPAVEEMAVCVASTNPDGIKALLRSQPQSAGEVSSLSALSPSLGQCLASNAKLTANRQSLRAALAEALYHRVTVGDGASPSITDAQQSAAVAKPAAGKN